MKQFPIRLDDDLHRKVRIEVAKRGTSIQQLVEDYLRSVVSNTPTPAKDKRGGRTKGGAPQS